MSDINKVIGIFTTKGGTGKTTIALNISYVLDKSLLVEMDKNYTLNAVLKIEGTEIRSFWEGKQEKSSEKSGGVKILTVRERLNPQDWKDFFERVKEYKHVLFDFHNAITQDILPPLQKADVIIVPSVPTMEGFGAYIHTTKNLKNLEIKYIGVVNMVHKSLFGVMKEEREIIEKMRSKGNFWEDFIPYDKLVVRASLNHKVAVAEYPKSPFAKAIKKLTKEVI